MPLHLVPTNDLQQLTPLLKEADEDISRIANTIYDDTNSSYFVFDEKLLLGAVVMHWHPDESEILYIAIDKAHRGHGYGKACITKIQVEAQNRHVHSLIVGTANSSLDNIAFYQKCGFRMDSIRKDYFNYLPMPIYEDGILIRDMLLLRMELGVIE
jgi:ribosomal protein S18 acetylase RimI-like enzyme